MGGSEMMMTNAPSILRNFIYDSHLCGTETRECFEELGLVLPSEEGKAMEIEMSGARVKGVENLLPLLATYASAAGGLIAMNVSARCEQYMESHPGVTSAEISVEYINFMTTAVMGAMTAVVTGLRSMGIMPDVVIHYSDEYDDE